MKLVKCLGPFLVHYHKIFCLSLFCDSDLTYTKQYGFYGKLISVFMYIIITTVYCTVCRDANVSLVWPLKKAAGAKWYSDA